MWREGEGKPPSRSKRLDFTPISQSNRAVSPSGSTVSARCGREHGDQDWGAMVVGSGAAANSLGAGARSAGRSNSIRLSKAVERMIG